MIIKKMHKVSQKEQLQTEIKEISKNNRDAEVKFKEGRAMLKDAKTPEQFELSAQCFSDAIILKEDKATY